MTGRSYTIKNTGVEPIEIQSGGSKTILLPVDGEYIAVDRKMFDRLTALEEFFKATTEWLDAHPHDDFSMHKRCVQARRAVEDLERECQK